MFIQSKRESLKLKGASTTRAIKIAAKDCNKLKLKTSLAIKNVIIDKAVVNA